MQFYQMQAELMEQRKKIAALTNGYGLLQEENRNQDVLIRDQAEMMNKYKGDHDSMLEQHVGVLIEKNVLKEKLAKSELALTNLQNEVLMLVGDNKRVNEELVKIR